MIMGVTEVESLDAAYLHSQYASGSLTPTQVVTQIYDKIKAYPDKAVWIHLLPLQTVLYSISSLPTTYSPATHPLYGIPFSVKDSIDIADLPTTLACPSYSYIPTVTAPVVQKCLDAGAILIGKTNLDQFATGLVGHRSPYGTPRCVYDAEYISGGSSSGSAVSVAAELVTLSIGTDTAGSTRVPASLNGLVGLKPSLGTLSTVGLVPAVKTADCVTVLARSMDDARRAWDVMRGYDEDDVFARQTLPDRGAWLVDKSLRFGVPHADLLSVLSPDYSKLYQHALTKIPALLNAEQSQFDYTPFESANNMLYGSSIVAQRIVAFAPYLATHGYDKMHPVVSEIFKSSANFNAVQAYTDFFTLASYKRLAEVQFRDNIDVLILPSTVCHWKDSEVDEDPIGRNKLLGSFTHFVNLLDLCAVSVPAGWWVNGNGKRLPFGITVVAQAGRDAQIMELGGRIMDGLKDTCLDE